MKEEILKKATEMFLTLGYKSVTMDDIAAEMGISKKTIYQHFANKPALVEETTKLLFYSIRSGIDNICAMGKNAIEELFAIKSFMMSQLNNETVSPFHQLQKYFPNINAWLMTNQFETMQDCVKENINKGIMQGLYRTNVDPEFTGRIYFVGVTGIRNSDIFPVNLYSGKAVTEQYLEYHLRAIVTPKGLELLENLMLNQS